MRDAVTYPLARARPDTAGLPLSTTALSSAEERAFLRRMILYGFLVRSFIALVLDWTGWALRFAPDAETYLVSGRALADYWSGEALVKPWRFTTDQPDQALGYFYINAVLAYVFGNTEMPIKLVNALVGALAPRYVYLIGRELFGLPVARRAVVMCEFFPSLILWSAVNIRDIWVVFLILFISWKSLQVVRGYSHAALVTVIAGASILSFFRDYLFYVVALPPVAAFLIGRRGHLVRNFLLAMVAGLGILLLVSHGGVGTSAGGNRLSLEALSAARRNLTIGGSAYAESVDISTPAAALMFLPTGIVYFLLAPFPWQITSTLKLFALPEMLLIYFLMPGIFRGIRYAVRTRFRDTLQVLLLTGLLTVAYALGEGNVGTLYRHRAQAMSLYLLFAAVGVELKRQRQHVPAA